MEMSVHCRYLGVARRAAADTRRAATDKMELGKLFYSMSHYNEALMIYKAYLALAEAKDPNGLKVADVCNNMAGVYKKQEKYARALELYAKARAIYEEVHGEAPSLRQSTADSYHNEAEVYGAQGEYENALKLYEKALAIKRQVHSEGDPSTA
eukprot:COSAG01_NODE_3260_length_6337_cov_11.824784_4_plen_152_part_01